MKQPKSFEEGMDRLQGLLTQLQDEATPLADSVKLYAEAAGLIHYCNTAPVSYTHLDVYKRQSLPRAAQIRCDVYARCTKAEGIAMALRCMNPQVIVCDELGTPGDAEAVAQGVASGVVFFATVHCDDPAGLRKKPALAALLDTGAFAKAAFLSGRSHPGAVAQWVTL